MHYFIYIYRQILELIYSSALLLCERKSRIRLTLSDTSDSKITEIAEVAELADALRSGRSGHYVHVGSTPSFGKSYL